MLKIRETKEGLTIVVYARAGARKNQVELFREGLKVSVAVTPQKGKANEAILELLSQVLHLKKQQLNIAKGHTSKEKLVLVTGITPHALKSLLCIL